MEVEPQRLIALSLGKIALSRGQRGGQRLHKSLLVAGVLLNARTACVSPCPMQSDDEEDLPSPFHEATVVETDADYRAEIFDEQHQFSLLSLEAVAPTAQCVISRSLVDRLLPVTHSEISPSDINLRQIEVDVHNLAGVSSDSRYSVDRCSRSTAIELTVVEPASCNTQPENTIFLSNNVSSPSRSASKRGRESTEYPSTEFHKRLRFNAEEYSSYPSHKASSYSTNLLSNHELMQTDNMHITSLVQTFNTGFSGLLHSIEPVEYTSCRYYGGDQNESDHETSSESIISCSTQIREALETLSRPMDTLTRPILAVSV